MGLETNNLEHIIESPAENIERKTLKEKFFGEIVEGKLFKSYLENLKLSGFNEQEINDFSYKLTQLSEEDRMSLLALPWELKQRALPTFKEQVNKNKITMDDMIETILRITKSKNDYKVCYHASNENILPKEEKNPYVGKVSQWVIKGTEKDHRDEDLPRAYYSEDYQHLYRNKNPKYIYLVAINQKSNKTDGAWGRASTLSVIDKIDISNTEKELEETMLKFEENKKKAKNAA